jgi:hypothetical protein
MLYAIAVYDLNEKERWEMIGYEIIFRNIDKAFSYAYEKTCDGPCFRYYRVEMMQEVVVKAGGLEDLIEP